MAITFVLRASVSSERRAENAAANEGLNLPRYVGSGPLAIVGGGPSIREYVEELRAFPGAIWAVNGTINWCQDNGIDAWLYTIDAQPYPEKWVYSLGSVTRAVLAADCDPSLFCALRGADVRVVNRAECGPTSAADADVKGIDAGHRPITFYGCESSFTETETHAFDTLQTDGHITVRVGGQIFRTKPEFFQQAQSLCVSMRAAPDYVKERSGGLLRAMVEHGPAYELVDVFGAYRRTLIERSKVTPEMLAGLGPDCFLMDEKAA